jgi:hypothetical protein
VCRHATVYCRFGSFLISWWACGYNWVLVHLRVWGSLIGPPCPRYPMTKPIARDPIYRNRTFDADVIELCVRRYITYLLSYRDPVEMMAEGGIEVAHSTILRWGAPLCSGIRQALVPVLQACGYLLARR